MKVFKVGKDNRNEMDVVDFHKQRPSYFNIVQLK